VKERISISVIIPTLNAEKTLGALLERLKKQEQAIDEIIVVDSSSEDNTVEVAERYGAHLLHIKRDSFDHGGTRNYAAGEARGDILVFMTQDVLPVDTKTIGNLVKPLLNILPSGPADGSGDIIVSYARQIAFPQASLSEQYLRLANYPTTTRIKSREDIPELGIKAFQNSNACAAYDRKKFNTLGGFPQPIVCNEDMIFAARAILAGYRVSYTAEAVVWHTHQYNCRQLFRRYFDIAASLDHEPAIRQMGNAESKGLDFLKGQLGFLQEKKKLYFLPLLVLEAAGKFLGFKAGERHGLIPGKWKKYLGMNTLYWDRNSC